MKRFTLLYLPPAALVVLVTLAVGLALGRVELDRLQSEESY